MLAGMGGVSYHQSGGRRVRGRRDRHARCRHLHEIRRLNGRRVMSAPRRPTDKPWGVDLLDRHAGRHGRPGAAHPSTPGARTSVGALGVPRVCHRHVP